MRPVTFFRALAFTALGSFLLIGVFNWWHDPAAQRPNHHTFKSNCTPGIRVDTTNVLIDRIRRNMPDVILAGSSRVGVGHVTADMPTDSMLLVEAAANLNRISRLIDVATKDYTPQLIILGLGLGDSLVHTINHPRIERSSGSDVKRWLKGYWSPSATLASLRMLTTAYHCSTPRLDLDGHWPNAQFERAARLQGPSKAVEAHMRYYIDRYLSTRRYASTDSTAALRRIAARACSRGTRLIAVFQPVHASMLEIIRQTGSWNDMETNLRGAVHEVAGLATTGCYVELWDFTGYSAETTQAFPEHESLNGTSLFWDPSHYKPALGKQVMASVLGQGARGLGLGIQLNESNIHAHLLNLRQARDLYAAARSKEVIAIEAMINAKRRKRPLSEHKIRENNQKMRRRRRNTISTSKFELEKV